MPTGRAVPSPAPTAGRIRLEAQDTALSRRRSPVRIRYAVPTPCLPARRSLAYGPTGVSAIALAMMFAPAFIGPTVPPDAMYPSAIAMPG